MLIFLENSIIILHPFLFYPGVYEVVAIIIRAYALLSASNYQGVSEMLLISIHIYA